MTSDRVTVETPAWQEPRSPFELYLAAYSEGLLAAEIRKVLAEVEGRPAEAFTVRRVAGYDYRIAGARLHGQEAARPLSGITALRAELEHLRDGSGIPPASLTQLGQRDRQIVHRDGERFDWIEASAFTLPMRVLRGEDVVQTLGWWREQGATVLRVFASGFGHPFWEHRGWAHRPDRAFYDAVRELGRVATEVGLYLRVVVFADTDYLWITEAERRRHADLVAEALVATPWHVVEIANEPSVNGFAQGDVRTLEALAATFLPRHSLVALGAEHGPRGHLSTYDRDGFVTTFHAERRLGVNGWEWVKRLGDYGVVARGRQAVLSGEPVNFGPEGRVHDRVENPAIAFAYGALSRLVPARGYAPCFHFDAGLDSQIPMGRVREHWTAFVEGCRAVPLSARTLPWTNGHHEGSPFRGYTQTEPPSDDRPYRIYGRGIGDQYIGVALRHPPGWTWPTPRYQVERVAEETSGRFACSVWKGK